MEKFAKRTSKLVKLNIPELSVAIVSDKEMIKLNKQYRKRNKTTDVLAFDYGRQFGGQGEIIICLPQAKKQAKQLKHSLKKELAILLVHGILHLAGYRDEKKKEHDIMMREQDKILTKLNI